MVYYILLLCIPVILAVGGIILAGAYKTTNFRGHWKYGDTDYEHNTEFHVNDGSHKTL